VGNSASYGGVYFLLGGSLTLHNNIFAPGSGRGCYVQVPAHPTIGGSNNLQSDSSCNGSSFSVYYLPGRIYSSNLLLGALGSYGGGTQTYPLLPGSPAIDAGDSPYCPAGDQRGMARVGTCDIGAFESQGFTLGSLTGTPQSADINTAFADPLGLTVAANNAGEPVDGGLVTFTPPGSGASAAITGSPATIAADGTASVTAVANGTTGGYNVTASARGAESVDYALTNTPPTSIVVTSDADSGPGTLRQAIADIATGGTISFAANMTVYLESTLTIAHNMTIDGTGYSVTVSGDTGNDGTANTGIFDIVGGTATLRNLLLEKGSGTPDEYGSPFGGAICVRSGAGLSLIDSTISGCHANYGGAIEAQGALAVTGSTFSNNSADYSGGAIFNGSTGTVANSLFTGNSGDGGAIGNWGTLTVTGSTFSGNSGGDGGTFFNLGTLTVTGSTFSGNSATSSGGVLYALDDTATLTNNTFVGNSASSGGVYYLSGGSLTLHNNVIARGTGSSCYLVTFQHPTIGGSNNLTSDSSCSGTSFSSYYLPGRIYSSNLLLGALGSYGGSTQTYPLLSGSPAIDAGDSPYCPAGDQRGAARVGTCDIGAFESQGFTLGSPTGAPQSADINTAFADPLGLTVAANNPVEPVNGGLVTFTAPGSGASAAIAGSPATIGADGTASVTATANGTAGSYTVTASTRGAADAAFALTNTYPQPVLDAIGPASAVAGSGDLSLAVTGNGFVAGSVVRWNGADLVTTYSGGTQLSATVLASSLAAVQTAQVTVYTPEPGGGTSSVLAFFVTEAAAEVVDQNVSSGTDPSAATGPASAAATGDGLLAVAEYDANPGGTPSFTAGGTYFDVYAAPGNSFSQVSIVACNLSGGTKLYWWDSAQGRWVKAGPQTYDHDTGCVTLVVDAGSSPSLSQLQGTFFAGALDQYTATALSVTPGSAYVGDVVTFSAVVAPVPPANGAPAGAVTFREGETVLAENVPLVDGQAQFSTSDLAVGSHSVTAAYGGDEDWEGSESSAVSLTVGKRAASVTLSTLEQSYDGQPKSVTVTTDPEGLGVDVTYNGSDAAPTEVGSYDVLAAVNDANYEGSATGTLIISAPANNPPVAQAGGPYLGAMNTAIPFDGSGSTDPDGEPLTYSWTFGDGGSATGAMPAHSYGATGIYDVCLTVHDGQAGSSPACTLAVVYDPNGGYVTGGGWINSPAGAYKLDPNLTGKATFGFVSKYKKGQNVPSGNTEFQFQAGGFNFHAETYEWLVVNQGGKNAQFKGSGTVNGGLDPNGNPFKFMIWAGDGSGPNGADTFRIRIWWEAGGGENVVYDNGVDQPIGGGSIVIHTK